MPKRGPYELGDLTERQEAALAACAADWEILTDLVTERVASSRERALCLTHLETAFLWIARAVAVSADTDLHLEEL